MRRRLLLEILESRVTPSTMGTPSPDVTPPAAIPAVVVASPDVTNTSTPSDTTPSAGMVAAPAVSATSAPALTAVIGSLTATNNDTATYSFPNATQGSSLTLNLGGSGQLTLSVLDSNGNVLSQQTGQGSVSLTVSNLPASGGVSVVVTATAPTDFTLNSALTPLPAAPTTLPPVTPPSSGSGFSLYDPNGPPIVPPGSGPSTPDQGSGGGGTSGLVSGPSGDPELSSSTGPIYTLDTPITTTIVPPPMPGGDPMAPITVTFTMTQITPLSP